ncbi:MAG: sugar ABC transporter permease [Clostridiales bacterium]|nr:sugar ABC transporter permease [Clostridiales bacterium]
MKKNGVLHNIRKYPVLYAMAIPVLAYFIIFHYTPMYGALMAFQKYVPIKGISGSKWIGLKNFELFFQDIYFFRIIRNTFLINLYGLIFGFPIPIIFALLLNEVNSKVFKKTAQTITYMPHFISAVVVCGLVKDFVSSRGVITEIYCWITGNNATNLLANPDYFRPIYTIMNIWKSFGWGSIIYFAALTGVNQELYEAASIDGANRFQQVLHVSLPAILPTIVTMLVLRLGNMMSAGYEQIILLYQPITYETADVISSYVYRRGLQEFDYGYSAAVGLFNSVINLIFILSANAVSKKINETSIW